MNLNLESKTSNLITVSSESLYKSIIDMQGCYIEVQDLFHSVHTGLMTLEQLIDIKATIKTYGCTESLLSLYGDNNIVFSVEGIGEAVHKAWEWIKEKLSKLKDIIGRFFKWLFNVKEKTIATANETDKIANNVENGNPPANAKTDKVTNETPNSKLANNKVYVESNPELEICEIDRVGMEQDFRKIIKLFMQAGPESHGGSIEESRRNLNEAQEQSHHFEDRYKQSLDINKKTVMDVSEAAEYEKRLVSFFKLVDGYKTSVSAALKKSESDLEAAKQADSEGSTKKSKQAIERCNVSIAAMTGATKLVMFIINNISNIVSDTSKKVKAALVKSNAKVAA